MLPILIGILAAIILSIYIENFQKPSEFVEPFILFGFVFFFIVFLYLSLKNSHFKFIKKSLFHFLIEILFIGLFTFIYCFLIYYFRGIKPHFINFAYLSLFFIIIHILLEISGVYTKL